jgi:hypothetical protein
MIDLGRHRVGNPHHKRLDGSTGAIAREDESE